MSSTTDQSKNPLGPAAAPTLSGFENPDKVFVPREHYGQVSEAFSRQAPVFDALDDVNPILRWMRARVRGHVLGLLQPGSQLLELNAGTGLDAAFFAEHGYFVHATDLSAGMIAQLRARIAAHGLHGRVTAEERGYTDLATLPAGAFDGIFSNFGGLNCVPDLAPVVAQFGRLLKPGGVVVLVVMPRVSPWELAAVFKGHFRMAFRRFQSGGVMAQVEDAAFRTWYFDPAPLSRAFGPAFECVGWQALGALVPPPHLTSFPRRFPRLFGLLCRAEARVGAWWPLRSCADHIILTMRYRG